MISRLRRVVSKERDLKMVWEVHKGGKRSFLVGTAHFFPYRFMESLGRYIPQADAVLFEGPLDEESAKRVVAAGDAGNGQPSLLDALDAQTIGRIQAELGGASQNLGAHLMYHALFGKAPQRLEWSHLKGLKPWMAFFQIWSDYLRKNGWTYNMELDALRIATDLGKDVRFLETIEEQIDALDHVPIARFVTFLKNVSWRASRREYVLHFLSGDLERLLSAASGFPTFCESIVGRRDPILYTRMKTFFDAEKTIAFVGAVHCRGITARLVSDGFRVRSLAVT